ncbi:putative transcription factor MADS-type1 family [Lupinus albus]|uniref:Putative transcription factor MADS-type1 family n=1 Tax=Lupinus albus TaxID=3870 RepID=A0A6A4PDY8_LUPAL|nr:putative transcription factor MADS-type1 family [Lupinus albus]
MFVNNVPSLLSIQNQLSNILNYLYKQHEWSKKIITKTFFRFLLATLSSLLLSITMARRNTKHTYIVNDAKRNVTYKKGKSSLIKKTMEISTLCGVDACAIIYNRNGLEPEVWPSHFGVQGVLYKFLTLHPLEQSGKMFGQESFLKQRIVKAQDQLKKRKIQN